MKLELEAQEESVEYQHLMTQVGLVDKHSIFNAVEWCINRNRKFTITTSDATLGWVIDLQIQPNESANELFEVFNEPKKAL